MYVLTYTDNGRKVKTQLDATDRADAQRKAQAFANETGFNPALDDTKTRRFLGFFAPEKPLTGHIYYVQHLHGNGETKQIYGDENGGIDAARRAYDYLCMVANAEGIEYVEIGDATNGTALANWICDE